MANTLRVKRRALGGASGAPSSLAQSELAWSEVDQILYIGQGSGGGASVVAIAGPGSYATSSQLASYLPLTGGTISSNLTITGDLTVNGTQTILNSTTLSVDDKNIVLGDVATPSDSTADGGGITLKGATDKTLNWVDATDAWTSSEHINVASGKAYYVNGASVLSSSTLGSGVTASSLTSVGTIATGVWQGTAIAVGYGGLGLTAAVTGLLKGNGTGYAAATAGTDYLDPNSDINGGTY
jgi:hypothetical protein